MSEELNYLLTSGLSGLIYVSLAVIVLAVGGMVKDFLTPYSMDEELTGKDNPALGLSVAGYYAAIILVFLGAVYDPGDNPPAGEIWSAYFATQVFSVFAYSLLGILFLNLARWLVDKLVLTRFSTHKEIIEDRNSGTGAVEFGSYLASALVVAGAVSGQLPEDSPWWLGPLSATVMFFLAQVVLVLFAKIYQFITSYDIHAEIEKDNVSAGVAFGGNLIAIGVVMLKGVSGDFVSWSYNLGRFAVWALCGFALLLVMRFFANRFFMPNSTIQEEIVRDQNINAAYLESALLIGGAGIIFFAL